MSERNKTQGRQTSRIYSPCILADHHPVSWLLSPPRRSVPIAVLPLGLVQAAASHAATHEQVNHASRGHKPRAIRGGDAAHENGRRARRGRRTVGEASSAHGRPLCVIGAYQRAERIFARWNFWLHENTALATRGPAGCCTHQQTYAAPSPP